MPKPYKFLDLSGYAFTGKHAVIDLVREFRGYHVPHFTFEFCLVRIQDGILDLKTALVDDWSPVRSGAAIRRYKKLVRRIGSKNSRLKPMSWFEAIGLNYDQYFNGRFFDLSEKYLDELIAASWRAEWPYAMAEWHNIELFWRRLKHKFGDKNAYAVDMYLAAPNNFESVTRRYLRELLSSNVSDNTTTIVMHNAFEPFNPYRSLTLFDDARCLVIDRDPRDNYVDQWGKPKEVAVPVEVFVKRYRLYRQTARAFEVPSDRVLRIRFEDLILNYEATLSTIIGFLGENRSIHVSPRKYFDPAVSRKNVGIWKTFRNQSDIEIIHRELRDYCDERVTDA